MNNNAEKDTKKVLDRVSITTSETSSHTFDTIDRAAKTLSDMKANKIDDVEANQEVDSKLATNDNKEDNLVNSKDNQYESRLKTNPNSSEVVNKEETTEEFVSRLKTNANKEDIKKIVNILAKI